MAAAADAVRHEDTRPPVPVKAALEAPPSLVDQPRDTRRPPRGLEDAVRERADPPGLLGFCDTSVGDATRQTDRIRRIAT